MDLYLTSSQMIELHQARTRRVDDLQQYVKPPAYRLWDPSYDPATTHPVNATQSTIFKYWRAEQEIKQRKEEEELREMLNTVCAPLPTLPSPAPQQEPELFVAPTPQLTQASDLGHLVGLIRALSNDAPERADNPISVSDWPGVGQPIVRRTNRNEREMK